MAALGRLDQNWKGKRCAPDSLERGGCCKQFGLKLHRLGRASLRNVRQKRDYFSSKKPENQPNSWLFLRRLSANKEFAFVKAPHGIDYPTPTPIVHNRHIVTMSLVKGGGVPLHQITIPVRLSWWFNCVSNNFSKRETVTFIHDWAEPIPNQQPPGLCASLPRVDA